MHEDVPTVPQKSPNSITVKEKVKGDSKVPKDGDKSAFVKLSKVKDKSKIDQSLKANSLRFTAICKSSSSPKNSSKEGVVAKIEMLVQDC